MRQGSGNDTLHCCTFFQDVYPSKFSRVKPWWLLVADAKHIYISTWWIYLLLLLIQWFCDFKGFFICTLTPPPPKNQDPLHLKPPLYISCHRVAVAKWYWVHMINISDSGPTPTPSCSISLSWSPPCQNWDTPQPIPSLHMCCNFLLRASDIECVYSISASQAQALHPCLNIFIPTPHHLNPGIYSTQYSAITITTTHFTCQATLTAYTQYWQFWGFEPNFLLPPQSLYPSPP